MSSNIIINLNHIIFHKQPYMYFFSQQNLTMLIILIYDSFYPLSSQRWPGYQFQRKWRLIMISNGVNSWTILSMFAILMLTPLFSTCFLSFPHNVFHYHKPVEPTERDLFACYVWRQLMANDEKLSSMDGYVHITRHHLYWKKFLELFK